MSATPEEDIKAAIAEAINVVRAACEKHPHKQWDLLVVAVPANSPPPVRIQMMTTVPVPIIPRFLAYIAGEYQAGDPS
jgi:hypothetical protein